MRPWINCPVCLGKGTVSNDPCPVCEELARREEGRGKQKELLDLLLKYVDEQRKIQESEKSSEALLKRVQQIAINM